LDEESASTVNEGQGPSRSSVGMCGSCVTEDQMEKRVGVGKVTELGRGLGKKRGWGAGGCNSPAGPTNLKGACAVENVGGRKDIARNAMKKRTGTRSREKIDLRFTAAG